MRYDFITVGQLGPEGTRYARERAIGRAGYIAAQQSLCRAAERVEGHVINNPA